MLFEEGFRAVYQYLGTPPTGNLACTMHGRHSNIGKDLFFMKSSCLKTYDSVGAFGVGDEAREFYLQPQSRSTKNANSARLVLIS